jgi:mitogen-activated protein kinase 1/3
MSNGQSLSLDMEHITIILFNMLSAVRFLQKANVIHRDLFPANILIDSQCNIKICGFSEARSIPLIHKKEGIKPLSPKRRSSNPCYESPETRLKEGKYGQAVDIWSIGCIFYELIMFSKFKINMCQYFLMEDSQTPSEPSVQA